MNFVSYSEKVVCVSSSSPILILINKNNFDKYIYKLEKKKIKVCSG